MTSLGQAFAEAVDAGHRGCQPVACPVCGADPRTHACDEARCEPVQLNPLERLAKRIEAVRVNSLCDDHGLSPEAEQHYLLALNALEQARRFTLLAHYAEMAGR